MVWICGVIKLDENLRTGDGGVVDGSATARQRRFLVAEDAFDGWQSEWVISSGK